MGIQEDAKELLPFMQAMAEGKVVQWNDGKSWIDKTHAGLPFGHRYRIKPPEPTYRPYTRDECVEHCLGKLFTHTEWKCVMLVTAVTDTMVYNGMELGGRTFDWLLAKCTHLDGSACGMKIEEESDARSY